MQKLFLFFTVLLLSSVSYCQIYTTVGAVQYQKLDGFNYKRTLVEASVSASWSFYPGKKFVRVYDGSRSGMADIISVKKVGNKTTYVIRDYPNFIVIVDGQTVTNIAGENQEVKTVFKIVKTEKIIWPPKDDN